MERIDFNITYLYKKGYIVKGTNEKYNLIKVQGAISAWKY